MPPQKAPVPTTAITFVSSKHEYGDVYTFTFTPEHPVPFIPGQYAHLRVPNVLSGKAVRELSIASAPSDSTIDFTAHVHTGSPFKEALHRMKPGEKAEVFKIKGSFVLPEEITQETPIILVAGGIGVTPFRSMLRERASRGVPLPIALVHVARGGFLYEEELRRLPLMQYRTQKEQLEETLRSLHTTYPSAEYFIAGAPEFVLAEEELLASMGVARESIKKDEFDGVPANEPETVS